MKLLLADKTTEIDISLFGQKYNESDNPIEGEQSYINITLPSNSPETVESIREKFTLENCKEIVVTNKDGVTSTKNNLKLFGVFDTITDSGRNLTIKLIYC